MPDKKETSKLIIDFFIHDDNKVTEEMPDMYQNKLLLSEFSVNYNSETLLEEPSRQAQSIIKPVRLPS